MSIRHAPFTQSGPLRRWFAAIGLACAFASASAASFDNVVIISDSLSDTGNLLELSTVVSQANPSLIMPLPPTPPYAPGRFSNGPLWVETLTARVGVDPAAALPAGVAMGPLPQGPVLPGQPGGNNYAIAGAFTGTGGTIFDDFIPTGLKAQLALYLSQHGGVADPSTLYVVTGGGNDIRAASLQPNRMLRRIALYGAARSYRDVVKALADAGARTILVATSPDVGATPEARYITGQPERATEATIMYNRFADEAMENLARHGNLTLLRLDMFALVHAIIRDATHNGGAVFGITNVDTSCLVTPLWIAGGEIPGAGTVDCDTALFADYLHPTAKAGGYLGNAAAACRLEDDATLADTPAPGDELVRRFCRQVD